jgi:hypothetical protein
MFFLYVFCYSSDVSLISLFSVVNLKSDTSSFVKERELDSSKAREDRTHRKLGPCTLPSLEIVVFSDV